MSHRGWLRPPPGMRFFREGDSIRTVETASAGAGGYCVPQAPAVVYLLERLSEDAGRARWARRTCLDLDDDRPIHDPVQERHRQRRIAQVLPQASKSMFVTSAVERCAAGVDHLVQQVRRLRRSVRSIRSKPNSSRITRSNSRSNAADAAASGRPATPSGPPAKGAGRVPHPIAQHTGRLADGLDEELAHAALADQNQVLSCGR